MRIVTPNGRADAVTEGYFVKPAEKVMKFPTFLDIIDKKVCNNKNNYHLLYIFINSKYCRKRPLFITSKYVFLIDLQQEIITIHNNNDNNNDNK